MQIIDCRLSILRYNELGTGNDWGGVSAVDALYETENLSVTQVKKFSKYAKQKRMKAFQQALVEYRDTIGEWDITDFKDAGPDWRETSNLKCDCGRLLRYQYTVMNRINSQQHRFGITHLKAETGFSDSAINAINRYLNHAEREIEEVEQRLADNWTLNVKIPETLVLPEELQQLIDEGVPLSRKEEAWLAELLREAQLKEWKKQRSVSKDNSHLNRQPVGISKEEVYRQYEAQRTGLFDLLNNERRFVDELLENGVGSAMVIAEELHKHVNYPGRYSTGRSRLYPLCVFYLEHLVAKGKAALVQNLDIEDRIYEIR